LGVQQLAYEICVRLAPRILAMFLLALSMLIWLENERLLIIRKTIIRLILLILFARFALPIATLGNYYIQENFFAEKISNANNELTLGSAELKKLTEFSASEFDGGWGGFLKNSSALLTRKYSEFKNAITAIGSNAENIIKHLLELAFLYVGIFLIQVVALPIIVFWLLVKFANSLFDLNVPVILHHSRGSRNGISRQSHPTGG